ncbi:MAG: GNAT family N-acetyltransferase, partial [Elusimicrobiota bacterium]|nr:GNAT family N-acetyltransferase [Elusimicrobiota bacterium]
MKIFSRLDKHKYKNEIFKLMQNGFNEPLSWLEFFFKELFEKYEVFGVLENTKLISIAFVSDKTLIFNAQKFYCPLISYVATDKNFLRQKNAFNLLAHIKKFYVQKNADGLYLCPTNPNVYISSGFE